jgi:hypothetical protein
MKHEYQKRDFQALEDYRNGKIGEINF